MSAYHGRSTDLNNLSVTLSYCRLPSSHVGAVREHCDTDEGKAVIVPREPDIPVLGTLILIGVEQQIDVADFVFEGVDKIDSSDLGDGPLHFLAFPKGVNERRLPATLLTERAYTVS